MITLLTPGSVQNPDGATTRPKEDPAKIRNAAQQFESLLIAQLLKSANASEGGWLGAGEDESSSSAIEYAQEIFAQSLASNGGLGLATLVADGLKP